MPVSNSQTPTVSVQVPVPTPVTTKPRKSSPKPASAPVAQPRPQAQRGVTFGGESMQDRFNAAPEPPLSAVVLPWSIPPKPERMQRKTVKVVQYARPINAVQPGETSHEALNRILGNRNERRLGRTSRVYRDGEDIKVRLHNTDVVTAHPNGQVTMNHGGHMSPTSRRFISGYSGYPVSFAGGRFQIGVRDPETGTYNWQDYENNTRFPVVTETPTDENSFRAAIAKNPYDATAHEAFADWLDEQGRNKEANYHREEGRAARELFPPDKLSRRRKLLRSN